MRRFAACSLAMCSLLLMALAEPPAHTARAMVAPGVSLTFVRGWEACDGGAAAHFALAGIPRSACGHAAPNSIYMRYMALGQPIDLWINQGDNPLATDALLENAAPGYVETVSNQLCAEARSQRGWDVANCHWDVGRLGGHPVLRLHSVITQIGDPLKMKYDVTGFSVADRAGYATVVASTPQMVLNKTGPIIAALMVSLQVESVAAAPSPPPPAADQMVAFSPAPGVSFRIPRDWIACDGQSEAQLTSARDSLNLKPKVCKGSPNLATNLRAFDPKPLHIVSVIFSYDREQSMTPESLADMAQADLDALQQSMCRHETEGYVSGNPECRIVIGTLAGHRAMVSFVSSSMPDATKWLILSYEVPYAHGSFQIQFAHSDLLTKLVQPEIDAIIASLQIDDGAPNAAAAPPGPNTPPPPKPGNADPQPEPPPTTVPRNSI